MGPNARRILHLFLLLAAASLAGCEGDTGSAGPQGPQGPAGPQGPTGQPGPSNAVPVQSADPKINVEVQSVMAPAGMPPTVEFSFTDDLGRGLSGLPAANISFILAQLTPGTAGASSEWQAYMTRSSAGIPNAQATTESATDGVYVDNSDGTYSYTFAQALGDYAGGPVFDESKTHRLGIEIRTNRGGFLPENIPANNAPYDFVPAGGMPSFSRLIVDNDTCNTCHDNLEFHGEARFDVEYCVTCHNPSSIDGDTVSEPWGGSVDMKTMIHKIHYGEELANGYYVVGFGGSVHDYSDVVFPQDVRNCTTCHNESDQNTPEASSWRLVANRDACGSCHDDIDWANAGHPGGFTFSDDTQCLDCHGPNATINGGAARTAEAHAVLTEIESQRFQYNILSITDTAVGENPVVQFSVTDPTNGNASYNIQTDPEFGVCAGGASRLAVSVAWDTRDYTNTGSGNDPAQPVGMNPLSACGGTSTDVGGGVFSVTSPTAIPATASGTLAVTIDGHPAVDVDGDGSFERIAVTNAIDYAPIDDPEAVPRREVVNIEKCDDCHNQLTIHGNNRTDEPQVCATCHNPNATDIRQRVAVASPTTPPSDCVNVLGSDDTSIDFKYMIHAMHAGGATGVPYEVCGFRNSVHVYDFTYPGKLANCEGCHNPDTYYPVDAMAVLGTTVDVGADASVPSDDTVISPNSSVCSTCHVSELAKQHMIQNGGDFGASKAADSSLISAGVETCAICHGPGGSADVKEAHGVGEFLFN